MTEVQATLRLLVKEEVSASMKKARGEMENLQKSADRTKGFVKDLFREMAGPAAGLGAGAALAYVAKEAVSAASNLEALQRRAGFIYGDAFPRIRDEAERLGVELGRSGSNLLDMAADVSTLAASVGLSTKQMQEMGLGVARLSADMASFFNITDEQAFETLRQGLSGAGRGLQRLGIIMSDTALEAFALSQGITTNVADMNDAQKVALRYNFILEKTKGVQGEAGRSSNSLANEMKKLSGTWGDFLEVAGTPLLPVVAGAISGVRDLLAALREDIQDTASALTQLFALRALQDQGVADEDIGLDPASGLPVDISNIPKDRREQFGMDYYQNVQSSLEPVIETFQEGKEAADDFWAATGGDEGADAAEEMEKLQEEMSDLGDTYADERASITQDLRELEFQHKERMADIEDSIAGVKDSMADLGQEYEKTLKSLDADEIDAVADQMERVKDLQQELADVQEKARRENAQGSVSVATNDEINRVMAELAKEQAALDAFLAANPGMAEKATAESGKTDFEQELENIRTRREEEKMQFDQRQQELQTEMDKLTEKKLIEEEAYTLQRQQYEMTLAALNAFETDYSAAMANIDKVTADTVESMRKRLEDLKNTISQIDALMQANAAITGGDTTAARVRARRDERGGLVPNATGGIYDEPTAALIGEAGYPEAVIPMPFGHIPVKLQGETGQGGVTITIGAVHVHNEADEDRLVAKLAREIQLTQLQSV